MIQAYAAIAFGLFAAGAIAGGLAIIALGIYRDGRSGSLTISSPNRMSHAARAACDVHTTPRIRAEQHDPADYPPVGGRR
jgi:hypothetical protein